MRISLLLASAAALAVTACNDRSATTEQAEGETNMVPAAQPAMASADYVTAAAISDMYEIESSRLAQEKGQSDQVKAHARQMIEDHTRTSDALKAAVADLGTGVQLPTSLDARHQQMIDDLRAAEGEAFDRLYMEQQRMAHEAAHRLHSGFAQGGDNPALQQVAQQAVPIIERHRAMFNASGSANGGTAAGVEPATASGNTAGTPGGGSASKGATGN